MSNWFKHDNNARNDIKIVRLRKAMGFEGTGMFWDLVGYLSEIDGHKWPSDMVPELASALQMDESKLKQMLQVCFGANLLQNEGGMIFSRGLLDRKNAHDSIIDKRKQAGKQGGIKSGEKRREIAESKQVLQAPLQPNASGGIVFNANQTKQVVEASVEAIEGGIEGKRDSLALVASADAPDPDPFGKIADLLRDTRARETGKADNVTPFEIRQLNTLFWAHGPEPLAQAIRDLGKLGWRATIDQIERWLKGERPNAKNAATQPNAPKLPKISKNTKPKAETKIGVTAQEAIGSDDMPF